jgi:hypothetical protein
LSVPPLENSSGSAHHQWQGAGSGTPGGLHITPLPRRRRPQRAHWLGGTTGFNTTGSKKSPRRRRASPDSPTAAAYDLTIHAGDGIPHPQQGVRPAQILPPDPTANARIRSPSRTEPDSTSTGQILKPGAAATRPRQSKLVPPAHPTHPRQTDSPGQLANGCCRTSMAG